MSFTESWSIFDLNFERQDVAFPTANLGFSYAAMCLITVRAKLDPFLKEGRSRPSHGWIQLQVFTGIGAGNSRHRTGLAQVRCPLLACGIEEAAFL